MDSQKDIDLRDITTLLEEHGARRGDLISILEDIQGKYGYLPEEALRAVGELTGRSLVDVYGVATFYGSFSLQPRGKHLVTVCLGTACMSAAPRGLSRNSNGSSELKLPRPRPTESSRWKR